MPIAGHTTNVPVAKSATQIQAMLAKAGVARMTIRYDNGHPTGVDFEKMTEWGPRAFSLPIRPDGVLATLKRDKVERRYLSPEHAEKVAWRIAHDWLRAQLAIIDAGMTTLDEVMFPWMLAPGGDPERLGATMTMVEAFRRQNAIEA